MQKVDTSDFRRVAAATATKSVFTGAPRLAVGETLDATEDVADALLDRYGNVVSIARVAQDASTLTIGQKDAWRACTSALARAIIKSATDKDATKKPTVSVFIAARPVVDKDGGYVYVLPNGETCDEDDEGAQVKHTLHVLATRKS